MGNNLTVGIEEFESIGAATVQACSIVDVECQIEATTLAIDTLVEDRDDVVANKRLGLGHKIDIAMDTAQPPHILSFEVRTVAPAIDAYR